MIKKKALLCILLLVPAALYGQQPKDIQQGYYAPPLDIDMFLSGNVGETRSNHFHSGIDIKTQGVEGKPVYAAADGYISRIGVSPTGYGRVLYIAHPNGTTTVYGHMQRFIPSVEEYVDTERHRVRTSRVDLYPKSTMFPVRRGELIGYSGNSGSSGGPHLHFEIRDSGRQRPLNVNAMKIYDIRDNMAPVIVKLHYVETDTINGIPVSGRPVPVVRADVTAAIHPSPQEPFLVGRSGYFILEVTDRKNDAENTMGVYAVTAQLDDRQIFSFQIDSFDFSETRYVNSFSQYDLQRGARHQFIKLAVQQNNQLSIYGPTVNRGAVVLNDHDVHTYYVTVTDDNGNRSTVSVPIRFRGGDRRIGSDAGTSGIPVEYNREFNRSNGDISVKIPAGALYESIFFTQDESTRAPADAAGKNVLVLSPVYRIHDTSVPLHKAMEVSVRVADVDPALRSGLTLATMADNGKLSYAGGNYADGRVTGKFRSFGSYVVVADTVPPVITLAVKDGEDLRGKSTLSFSAKDNFSAVASCTATIDGEWVALDQKSASSAYTIRFDDRRISYSGGEHVLEITATDSMGNSTTVTRRFIR